MNIDILLNNTINLIIENDKKFCKYSKPYLFTTENIKGYYELLELQNKDILTVCSSGDHVFNAILCGANKVDTFDINYFQKLVFYLKKAAIRYYSDVEEFKNFFLSDNNFLDNSEYNKIKKYFDLTIEDEKEAKEYWNQFTNGLNYLYCTNHFFKEYNIKKYYIDKNIYLEKEKYINLRKRINNVETKFVNCNILDLSKKIKEKYDVILLSNIADYLQNIFSSDHLEKYHDLIINEISKMLNEDGQIMSAYLYYYKDFQSESFISNPRVRKEIFHDFLTMPVNHKYKTNDDSEDAILVYKK